jgi:hypothetical protein
VLIGRVLDAPADHRESSTSSTKNGKLFTCTKCTAAGGNRRRELDCRIDEITEIMVEIGDNKSMRDWRLCRPAPERLTVPQIEVSHGSPPQSSCRPRLRKQHQNTTDILPDFHYMLSLLIPSTTSFVMIMFACFSKEMGMQP